MHGFIVLDGTPPAEILERGREQVRHYGGKVVFGEVTAAEPADVCLRLADGSVIARSILAVATRMQAGTDGLDGLKLPMEDLPDNMGPCFVSGLAGTTDVPGVWVAGDATDPAARVRASAATGALADAHINSLLVTADTDAVPNHVTTG
jgi:thioredoxin reductase